MSARAAAVERLRCAARADQNRLSEKAIEALRRSTEQLLQVTGLSAEAEYDRFVKIAERGLKLDDRAIRRHLAGKKVLVTGGTGCIGTKLLGQLSLYDPARIASISRGITKPAKVVDGVEYLIGDVRSLYVMRDTVRALKPDIVFHLAAQHDPGLAENEVPRSLGTNIAGTRHVIDAARRGAVEQIVYASTGKAMRLLSTEVYAASKKASEALMAGAAQSGDILASGVRFTHVVDNSIIHERLRNWIDAQEPIRLHDTDILFYVQSALESAQLLMDACLNAEPKTLRLEAIRDLDWPISLLDMTVGALARNRSGSPIYVCGYEAGYQEMPYPALFDSLVSGDVSPLINAFEAADVTESRTCAELDVFPFTIDITPKLQAGVETLCDLCERSDDSHGMKRELAQLSWAMLDARLAKVSLPLLRRSVKIMEADPNYGRLPAIHQRTNEAVKAAIERRTSDGTPHRGPMQTTNLQSSTEDKQCDFQPGP
jgi:NAD(P)-dependent dehydrogenase (short-subunit alcohol dehydrogenase family)